MLLLAWQLPPLISGGVYRPLSFLKYGPGLGWTISTISGAMPQGHGVAFGNELLESVPEEVVMVRVPERSRLKPSWRWFPRIDRSFLSALSMADAAFKRFGGAPPSIVLASGPYFHSFAAAYYIARYFRAKLILDYRDEWSVEPREFIHLGSHDRKWEARFLARADAVTFTAPGFMQLYIQTFPELDERKCHLVPNGWDPNEFTSSPSLADRDSSGGNGRYIISFVGRCGRFLPPDGFLRTLECLLEEQPDLKDRLMIRFVGVQGPEALKSLKKFRQRYPDVLDIVGEVEKTEAIRLMMESTGLLLLNDSDNKRFIPVKVYEYLASGPALLVYGAGGVVEDMVSGLNAGLVIARDDHQSLGDALADIMKNKRRPPDRDKIEEWLLNHTRERLANEMFGIAGRLERSG